MPAVIEQFMATKVRYTPVCELSPGIIEALTAEIHRYDPETVVRIEGGQLIFEWDDEEWGSVDSVVSILDQITQPLLPGIPSVVEGDRITVRVGGQEYETVVVNGIQRFVEDKHNPLYRRLRSRYDGVINPDGDIADLNEMTVMAAKGKISPREYAEFNMALGYSVCGFADIFDSTFHIDNPLWN
jgi:hypothetical protein